MPTIAQTIEREENIITEYVEQLNKIEKLLKNKSLKTDERSDLELEHRQITKKKTMTETMVGKLRKENRVTMLFSVLVMSIGVILYFGAEAFYNT